MCWLRPSSRSSGSNDESVGEGLMTGYAGCCTGRCIDAAIIMGPAVKAKDRINKQSICSLILIRLRFERATPKDCP